MSGREQFAWFLAWILSMAVSFGLGIFFDAFVAASGEDLEDEEV